MRLKILESIADIIESRPVLGHWPHMRAGADADYLRSIAAELTEAKSTADVRLDALTEAQGRVRALEAELADQVRVTEEFQKLLYQCETENTRLADEIAAELALRQTAEGYTARNALRVIELEEVLQEMLDVRGVNTQEAYDVRARARKTLGSTLYPIDTSATPVEESAKDRRIAKLESVLRVIAERGCNPGGSFACAQVALSALETPATINKDQKIIVSEAESPQPADTAVKP